LLFQSSKINCYDFLQVMSRREHIPRIEEDNMDASVFNNIKESQLVEFIRESNNTYNLTENDLQVLQNLLSILKHKRNTSNIVELDERDEDCGGRLRNFAETYASHYHSYFAIFVCVFGTIANVLNIIVLTRKDMACAPINRILTALAVADILLMVEYIPYVYYHYMALPKSLDFPYQGAIYMLFHVHITQILHTTSICLNLTLAVWRYLALRLVLTLTYLVILNNVLINDNI
jgi:hypothetical protein